MLKSLFNPEAGGMVLRGVNGLSGERWVSLTWLPQVSVVELKSDDDKKGMSRG